MFPPTRSIVRVVAILFGVTIWAASLSAQVIAERLTLFSSGHDTPFELHPWNMSMELREGGVRDRGTCLWLNTDWQAKPWAGIRFDAEDAPAFTVTEEWLEKGFIRFYLNVTVDRHGNIGGGDQYQLKPIVDPPLAKYQAVRSQFIDRGRGVDQEASTWQEVLVPLKYFTELEPGHVVSGLHVQTRYQVELAFSLDDVEYIRFAALPQWMLEQLSQNVMQDWVEWPAYEHLPAVVKADRNPPLVRDGTFVTADGNRAFLINPYCREDSRIVYGVGNPDRLPPTYDLYSREKHGWIYDEIPSTEHLCRLGFNSFSVTPNPAPWWTSVGYAEGDADDADAFLAVMSKRIALPYYVDLVSWPWTMGRPGLAVSDTNLPPEAATQGRHHWTQYRIIGAGRKAWLDMWTLNARRYRDAGARVAVVELLNEPAYMGESDDHHAEFERWLQARYGSIAAVNRTWGTDFDTMRAAARYRFSYDTPPPAGQRLDYDAYLAERFETMIEAGVEAVTAILPDALVGVQPMGGYLRTPHDAVWKHRIARHETVVLTPTGGGRWTRGAGAVKPGSTLTSHRMANAPIENDLLLAVADSKMIVDNETYLRGQTRVDTRNRLWEHVVCGLDGLTVFSWSKRGWVWWRDRSAVQVDADKFPYSCLIPLARRTDALRGILDFSIEVQTLAPRILAKPWGPEPRIGLIYSWDNARRRTVEPELYDKLPVYYAALRYSHWNMALLPSDRIIAEGIPDSIDVLVAGALRHVEPELPAAVRRFVEAGGTLILGECDFTQDIHGRALPANSSLAPGMVGDPLPTDATIGLDHDTETRFPGAISVTSLHHVHVPATAHTVFTTSAGRPAVVRNTVGDGVVYVQGADVYGYALAKLLHATLTHAAGGTPPPAWRAVTITEEADRLAANVLVSRRSYAGHHAILLHNRDQYDRTVRVAIPGLTGSWTVRDALTNAAPRTLTAAELATGGVEVPLSASGPAVLLLTHP